MAEPLIKVQAKPGAVLQVDGTPVARFPERDGTHKFRLWAQIGATAGPVDPHPIGDTRSGLPWLSGVTPESTFAEGDREVAAFEEFRGREADCSTTFANWKEGWDAYLKAPGLHKGLQQALDRRGLRLIVSLATVVKGDGCTIAEAAAGKYDRRYEALGDIIAGWGLSRPPILRVNWEMSQTSRPYSPNNDKSPGFRDSKAMWRRAVEIWRAKVPGALIDWCHLKRPSGQWQAWYPGDDLVDSIGVDFYGNNPACKSLTVWRQYQGYMEPFLDFARQHGKKVTFPEWGITIKAGNKGSPSAKEQAEYDQPIFIQGMFDTFDKLADEGLMLAESYFHRHWHQLTERNAPRCREAYKRLWGQAA